MASPATFRYQLSYDALMVLRPFAQTSASLPRQAFKDKWCTWLAINAQIVEAEEARLTREGYKGCVRDKMYKSARYYFKNRPPSLAKKPRARNANPYIALAPAILSMMDAHIASASRSSSRAKPSTLYTEWALSLDDAAKATLGSELGRSMAQGGLTSEEAAIKVKKTYKNRYFKWAQGATCQQTPATGGNES